MKIRKYPDYLDPNHHDDHWDDNDENQVDNNVQEVDNEDQEVSWKEELVAGSRRRRGRQVWLGDAGLPHPHKFLISQVSCIKF